MLIPATLSSSHLRRNQKRPQKSAALLSGPRHMEKIGQGKKVGHKDLWLLKMGHGTKRIENQHWNRNGGGAEVRFKSEKFAKA